MDYKMVLKYKPESDSGSIREVIVWAKGKRKITTALVDYPDNGIAVFAFKNKKIPTIEELEFANSKPWHSATDYLANSVGGDDYDDVNMDTIGYDTFKKGRLTIFAHYDNEKYSITKINTVVRASRKDYDLVTSNLDYTKNHLFFKIKD